MPRRAKSSGGLLREVEEYLTSSRGPDPAVLYWPGGGGGGGSRRRRGGSPVVRPHPRTSAHCTRCGQYHTQAEHARHDRGRKTRKTKTGRSRAPEQRKAKARSATGSRSSSASPLKVVLDAVARVPERDRLGRSVLISRVYRKVGDKIKMSLPEFKRWLLTENRAGRLVIQRLDLVELFPEREVEASEIDDRDPDGFGATFHLIVDPSYRELG